MDRMTNTRDPVTQVQMTAVSCYRTHVHIPSHESVSVLMKSRDIKESQDEISSYLITL